MDDRDVYDNPLIGRYAGRRMARLWSPRVKFSTWRRLWVALAEAERDLGLTITEEQIAELRAPGRRDRLRRRQALRAAVPARCDGARPRLRRRRARGPADHPPGRHELLRHRQHRPDPDPRGAGDRARQDRPPRSTPSAISPSAGRTLPCLGYTHFQPAQLATVGKRATLWCYDLVLDLREIEHRIAELKFRGVKGTTGTQASFLALFDGDHAKVEALDRMVAEAFGFDETYPVTGQTYSRKVDAQVLAALAGLAESAHKFGTDLRLLAHERELEEPFEAEQIGSSAMAYKRNPMRAERMCSLARFVMRLPPAASQTAATQWLERTLDDSAIRRLIAAAGVSRGRRDPDPVPQRRAGPGRPPRGDRAATSPRSCRSWRPRTC